jgi:hypothetical protein
MNEQMRKEFEEYWEGESDLLELSEDVKQVFFECWQASRQSLVVKLPRATGDAVYDAQEVLDALDAAGIRYE